MASIPFEPAVGHPAIDAQHRAIAHQLTEVRAAVGAGDREGARKALASLWDETVGHFATEEALMEMNAYPERVAHGAAHRLFLEDLRALLAEVDAHGLGEDAAAWAGQRVPEWLSFHIQTNDAPLARYIARRSAREMVQSALGQPPPDRSRRES